MKALRSLTVCLFVAAAAFAGGPDTDPASATSTSTVTLIIPGLVGVDVESNVEFNFNSYTPAGPAEGCVDYKWPVSITCGAGTVHLDPTTITTTAATGAAPSNVQGDKAIWLAVFSSKTTGSALDLDVDATISAFSAAPGTGLTSTIISTKRSASNNGKAVGYASFTPFTAVATPEDIATAHTLTETFPWTRVDQAIGLELPYNASLNETLGITATLTYTVSK
ncbi:MAG TPA: hypothetical protein VFV54_07185 [Thermoanaerobaculia bacterium]|nr:hypothetical protein [Thermoanaerobaculia bacterium]